MTGETIHKAFQDAGITTAISCHEAWALAEKLQIPKSEIGRYCSEHGIKIRHCQLGCFA
jgi:hypothetical protein